MRPAILVAEAQARGFDKDPQFLREMRELEDRCLLDKVLTDKALSVPEPTDEQIQACFEKDKERFGENATLKVDQIWCKSLAAARKAKEMLDGGASFESTKKACSEQKDVQPYNIYPGGEGPFWADLWKGEPNQVVGPVKVRQAAEVAREASLLVAVDDCGNASAEQSRCPQRCSLPSFLSRNATGKNAGEPPCTTRPQRKDGRSSCQTV